jgi:hypothetical protein
VTEGQGHEAGPTAELARLHRVEAAARDLLNRAQGRRSATQMLEGMAGLRAALDERRHDDIPVGAHTLMDEAFGHHVWATTRLIDACLELSPGQLETALAGTYGSILETMRHLVGSDAWYLFDITGDRDRRIETESMDLTALRAEMEADGASWSRFLAEDPAPGAVLHEVDESDGSSGRRRSGSAWRRRCITGRITGARSAPRSPRSGSNRRGSMPGPSA